MAEPAESNGKVLKAVHRKTVATKTAKLGVEIIVEQGTVRIKSGGRVMRCPPAERRIQGIGPEADVVYIGRGSVPPATTEAVGSELRTAADQCEAPYGVRISMSGATC